MKTEIELIAEERDGHIEIWKRSDVLAVFPNAAELFQRLPNHYCSGLGGVDYDHCYYGDNLSQSFTCEEDWWLPHQYVKPRSKEQEAEHQRAKEETRQFVAWLEKHSTHWEVWA